MKDDLNFFGQKKDDLNFFGQKKDYLNILVYGRQPKLFGRWKTILIIC